MKKLMPALAVILFLAACNQQEENKEVPGTAGVLTSAKALPLTTIQWIDSAKNVGKVTDGEKVEITYRFKNTGDNQLVIQNVMVSCGCTVAEKPEKPIAPGEEGLIKAAFDSKGRLGTNHKTITVYANTPQGTHTVSFDVEVEKKN